MLCSRLLAAVVITFAAACDQRPTPTGPDSRFPPTTGPPFSLSISQWTCTASETTARVEALWSNGLYRRSREVTSEASWHSNDPNVFIVMAPGRMVSNGSGDGEVQIAFRGVTTSHRVRVYEGMLLPLALTPAGSTSSMLSGRIVNHPDNPNNNPGGPGLAGVTAEIIGGPHVGRVAVSDAFGWYRFLPPWAPGPQTIRLTKAGYREIIASSAACEQLPRLSMQPES